MAKVSIKVVVIGGAVDLFSSFLGTAILFVVLISILDFEHTPKDQFHVALSRMLHESEAVRAIELFAGFGCTALGGYVAAWIAKSHFLLNGALSSGACLLLDGYWIYSGKDHHSLLVRCVIFVSTPIAAALGGYLKEIVNRKRAVRSGL